MQQSKLYPTVVQKYQFTAIFVATCYWSNLLFWKSLSSSFHIVMALLVGTVPHHSWVMSCWLWMFYQLVQKCNWN